MSINTAMGVSENIVAVIRSMAPDMDLCGNSIAEMELKIAEGDALVLRDEMLYVQCGAMVVAKHDFSDDLNESNNRFVYAIRASQHPKRNEVLRALGYKMPWEYGTGPLEDVVLPIPMPPLPSGQSSLAA